MPITYSTLLQNSCIKNKAQRLCPIGWIVNEQQASCYKSAINNLATSWPQAEATCESINALLTSVRNKNEKDFLERFVNSNVNKKFWIGGHKRSSDNSWVWTGQTGNIDTNTNYIQVPNQM